MLAVEHSIRLALSRCRTRLLDSTCSGNSRPTPLSRNPNRLSPQTHLAFDSLAPSVIFAPFGRGLVGSPTATAAGSIVSNRSAEPASPSTILTRVSARGKYAPALRGPTVERHYITRTIRLQATITDWRKPLGPLRSPGRLHWWSQVAVGGPVARGARDRRFSHSHAPVAIQPHGLSDASSARPYSRPKPKKTKTKRPPVSGRCCGQGSKPGTHTSCAPLPTPKQGRPQGPPPASVAVLLSCRFRLRPLSHACRYRKTATLARPPGTPDSPAFATFRSVTAPVATAIMHHPHRAAEEKTWRHCPRCRSRRLLPLPLHSTPQNRRDWQGARPEGPLAP